MNMAPGFFRRRILLGGLFLVLVMGLGRPGLGAERTFGRSAGDGGQATLAQARELLNSGETEQAVSLLRGVAIGHYDPALRYQAHLLLARTYLLQGDVNTALLYLERVPTGWPDPLNPLVRGAALIADGQTEAGTGFLNDVRQEGLAPADQAIWYQARTQAMVSQGEPLAALVFLGQGSQAAGEDQVLRERLLETAHEILRDRLDDAQLAEAAFMWRGTPLGQDAALQKALRAYQGGRWPEAEAEVRKVVESSTPFPYRNDAILLWERISGKPWLQRAVGVMLPLSGRYRTFGELVQRGMELAIQSRQSNSEPVRFLFRDSGADADQTARTVTDLANSERVMAIVGPLTGGAATAAAERAQQERVPLLTLSQKQGLPETGAFVFRDSLTSRMQVQALVEYAMVERELTTFAVLYPENRLGQEMHELFRAEVERRGGQIVAVQAYSETATDFKRSIKLLKGEDPDAPEEEAPPPPPADPNAPPPVPAEEPLPFEALFIPDYADRIGLLAPQLAYYGIEKVQLLGINGWNSPELMKAAGRFINGAVFVDGFFRYSPYPFVQDFVNRFFEKYGEEPSILEAQGYDAANIVLNALDQPEVRTRQDLRIALSRLQNFPGVTGATSFNLFGEAEKVLFLLQIHNGTTVQIN